MTPIPYIITPPASLPVTLTDMKAHLRTVHDDDDADIEAKIAGAVATLDAWGGMLGRCIMPQTWAIDVTGPGPHLLPFPEATDATAEGVSGSLAVTLTRGARGPCATVVDAEADEPLVIQFDSGMSAERLPVVQTIIKLMVQREFDALSGPDYDAMTRTIESLVNTVRWRRV